MRLIEAVSNLPGGGGHLGPPLRTEDLTTGLHAIQWTVEDRGLAGTKDLRDRSEPLCSGFLPAIARVHPSV